jgi:hypothetical protein
MPKPYPVALASCVLFIVCCSKSLAQDSANTFLDKALNIPDKFSLLLSAKASRIQAKLERTTAKISATHAARRI